MGSYQNVVDYKNVISWSVSQIFLQAFSSEANEIFDDDYDDYVIDESNHFDLLDLVDSLPNINVTDADVTNIGLLITNQPLSF